MLSSCARQGHVLPSVPLALPDVNVHLIVAFLPKIVLTVVALLFVRN